MRWRITARRVAPDIAVGSAILSALYLAVLVGAWHRLVAG